MARVRSLTHFFSKTGFASTFIRFGKARTSQKVFLDTYGQESIEIVFYFYELRCFEHDRIFNSDFFRSFCRLFVGSQ